MLHEGEVLVAILYPLGFTPKGQTRNILIHSQAARLSTAYTGVHKVHIVHKKEEKPSTASLLSTVSTPIAPALHPKQGRRMKLLS